MKTVPRSPLKKTKPKKKRHIARIAYSELDQMEARLRHQEFRRLLPLWIAIHASKHYVGLTPEEEQELHAVPRTRFQIAAMMEADDQWLSRSITDIKRRAKELLEKAKLTNPVLIKPTQAMWREAEERWVVDAVKLPFGDQSNALMPILPADLSSEFTSRYTKESMGLFRENTGHLPTQICRRPDEDPWLIYERMQEPGTTLAKVRDQMFGPYDREDARYKKRKSPRSAKLSARVKADLKKVRNAYRYAVKVLASLKSR